MNLDDLRKLSDTERNARRGALAAIALARREGISIHQAAREVGVTMTNVRRWGRSAFGRRKGGETFPTREDRITRFRPVIFEGGGEVEFAATAGSEESDLAHRVFDVQWRFIEGDGSEKQLDGIRGTRVVGRLVEADPEELEAIAERGEDPPEEVYRSLIA